MNEKTKLLKYVEKNNIKLIDIFRATMGAEGVSTISYKTIWNIAHGYTNPVLSSMRTIAKVLKVDIDTIF
uniref:HTH cro/C1-type domain-containing protein n=1 Tax=viral metagenome TaxID=1070528 RepID=A0A6H2A102_9ZZZZ